MKACRRGAVVLCILLAFSSWPSGLAFQAAPPGVDTSKVRDGAHEFDWDVGVWKVHQRRLLHPLTGSNAWTEYDGTDTVQKIWNGADAGTIESDGPSGHLEIYTLRLYDPDSREWRIYFTNSGGGPLSTPVIGRFQDGTAEFYDQESYKGKTIFVRFRISGITPNSCRFDQAFSANGGKSWEVNFIVAETLVQPGGNAQR